MQIPAGTVPVMTPDLVAVSKQELCWVHQATLQGKGCRAANCHDPHGREKQRTQGLNPATGSAARLFFISFPLLFRK